MDYKHSKRKVMKHHSVLQFECFIRKHLQNVTLIQVNQVRKSSFHESKEWYIERYGRRKGKGKMLSFNFKNKKVIFISTSMKRTGGVSLTYLSNTYTTLLFSHTKI